MKRAITALAGLLALVAATSASAGGWTSTTILPTNTVVSGSPVTGGGYPVPPGAARPDEGTCRAGLYNSNHSESWLAVKPGTESIVGASKYFFENFSTFYDFHLGSYTVQKGKVVAANQVQGYDCTTAGPGGTFTQAMPPSWTNNTDPNADFDTQGRVYQTTLPFNAYWAGGMHPNGEIDVSYSDDLGRHWLKANGGAALDSTNNQTSTTYGHVEDKQWIAVNHVVGNVNQDHVYAMWTTFNGAGGNGKIMVSISRDRGASFSKAVQLTTPSATTPANTYVYPSIGSDGTVYVAFVSGYDTTNKNRVGHVYVTRSTDDGVTWGPFVLAASPVENPNGYFANTSFRDGIIESFAASPTYPGHAYLTYENWDSAGGTSDVYFTQTLNGGMTWSPPMIVNDDAGTASSDQFQPSVAAGTGGAVAVAFYDRRASCPADSAVLAAHRGDANTCIDVSVQAYKDAGAGAVAAGPNVRASTYAWDPDQPTQKVGGLTQYPCAGHSDPCDVGRGFIGDYFGLAISNGNVYTLAVSTHYPSGTVKSDSGGPVYYQEQVLGTLSRAALGI
jgi:hypothetical protein